MVSDRYKAREALHVRELVCRKYNKKYFQGALQNFKEGPPPYYISGVVISNIRHLSGSKTIQNNILDTFCSDVNTRWKYGPFLTCFKTIEYDNPSYGKNMYTERIVDTF